MNTLFAHFYSHFKLILWGILVSMLFIEQAMALDEIFDTYNSPQCLAQGNACTASTSGFASHFYNPAALTKFTKKHWEANLVVLDGQLSAGATANMFSSQSLGTYRFLNLAGQNPGIYNYFNFSTLPSITFRNFSFAILGSYQFAALSDGTLIDLDTRQDIVPTVGFSRSFAGNLLKLGVSGKAILRNQMKGAFSQAVLDSTDDKNFPLLFKEGVGLGVNSGLLLTLPHRFLPTLGISWLDMFGTRFSPSHYLNPQSSGTPESIPQSFHAGFSLSPAISRTWKSTLSVDYRHIELSALSWRKHLHVGLELQSEKSLLFWLGLNQLYLTAGMGLRVQGGNLEMGTYAKEIGTGDKTEYDRRFFFRYTISF
ncbi:MAG: hypothetical protein EB120_09385 [Proteobacteria bacterium]|nr:hypothetical protein [Pseudomonadota bacterium]NDC23243.1 hypothetical protein [Pseudomonadota bacterium]NDG27373.1 hypothetical protein [Pseudomonadota bacterium]